VVEVGVADEQDLDVAGVEAGCWMLSRISRGDDLRLELMRMSPAGVTIR
jgi:hypothetical protein